MFEIDPDSRDDPLERALEAPMLSLSVYSRCICSTMVGVPHRPLLPAPPTLTAGNRGVVQVDFHEWQQLMFEVDPDSRDDPLEWALEPLSPCSHYPSTLDAVYGYVVPWSMFLISPTFTAHTDSGKQRGGAGGLPRITVPGTPRK